MSEKYSPAPGYWDDFPLTPDILAVAMGSFTCKNPPHIKRSGYVVQSLEAALWAFSKSQGFQEGCLLAVNLGDDADTTGAVYGQLAGAFYGVDAIPPTWLPKLVQRELIEQYAEQLYQLRQR